MLHCILLYYICSYSEVGDFMYYPQGCLNARNIFQKSEKFLVYYDPDNDGLIAGYLCEVFLKALGKSFSYYINNDRAHGFLIPTEKWIDLKGYTIFAVDFSMSVEEVKTLTDLGVNIINIDHHSIDEDTLYSYKSEISGAESVIINNQYCFEPEEYRFLSGAGMVYYVLGSMVPEFMTSDTKALVGISLLTDIRAIENNIAFNFLTETYRNHSDKFEYLVNLTKSSADFNYGVQNMDRNFVDYSFSPKLNALFRLNMNEVAISIIRGDFPVSDRAFLDSYKSVQNSIIDRIVTNLQGYEGSSSICKYVSEDLYLVDINYKLDLNVSNFIGVACSRVKNFGKTSFLYVLGKNGKIARGSVRGKFDNVDYLSIFRKHGFYCEGHKVAFGVIDGDVSSVNWVALDAEINEAELSGAAEQYKGRLFETSNLAFSLRSTQGEKISLMNNYVRDSKRTLFKYTGDNVKVEQKGKMWLYKVDGFDIKCFDEGLNLDNGYILPLLERSGYLACYLRRPN